VSYRKQHPDEETVKKVLEVLKEHNIDINKLVEYPTNHCQLAKSPIVEGMRFGMKMSVISNIL
jgi:arsenate reductase-like glutaredoxin family protein